MIRVAFKRAAGGTVWEKLISFVTRGPYCHVAVIYPGGRLFSSDERIGGVGFESADTLNERWDIYNVAGEWFDGLKAWCEQEIGCKYDWIGAILCPWRLRWLHNAKWFCSEMVATVLNKANHVLFDGHRLPKIPTYYSPNDLALLLRREGAVVQRYGT